MNHDAGHHPDHGGPPGYETSDASWRGIVQFAVWLFGFLAISQLALLGLYEVFVNRRPPPETEQSSDTIYQQLRALRQSEDETLSTYGWVDRKAGLVRIPIDRALDLVAERGVPTGKGPRSEAEVNSHHGVAVKKEEKKAEERKENGKKENGKKENEKKENEKENEKKDGEKKDSEKKAESREKLP